MLGVPVNVDFEGLPGIGCTNKGGIEALNVSVEDWCVKLLRKLAENVYWENFSSIKCPRENFSKERLSTKRSGIQTKISNLRVLINTFERARKVQEMGESVLELGLIFYQIGDFKNAVKTLPRATSLLQEVNDDTLVFKSLVAYSVALISKALEGENGVSAYFGFSSISLSEEDMEDISKAYQLLSELKDKLDSLTGDEKFLGMMAFVIQTNLGLAKQRSGELNEAKEHFRQALTVCLGMNPDVFPEIMLNKYLAISFGNLGWSCFLKQDAREAKEYFLNLLSYSRKLRMRDWEVVSLLLIQKSCFLIANESKLSLKVSKCSLAYLEKAIEKAKKWKKWRLLELLNLYQAQAAMVDENEI